MLSNITAGNAAQIEAVYQSGCVPQLIHLVQVIGLPMASRWPPDGLLVLVASRWPPGDLLIAS